MNLWISIQTPRIWKTLSPMAIYWRPLKRRLHLVDSEQASSTLLNWVLRYKSRRESIVVQHSVMMSCDLSRVRHAQTYTSNNQVKHPTLHFGSIFLQIYYHDFIFGLVPKAHTRTPSPNRDCLFSYRRHLLFPLFFTGSKQRSELYKAEENPERLPTHRLAISLSISSSKTHSSSESFTPRKRRRIHRIENNER